MSVSTFSSDFVHTALIQMGANQIKVVSGKPVSYTHHRDHETLDDIV